LHAGFHFRLVRGISAGGNLYYGSGFTDGTGYSPAHLPGHVTFDLSLSKTLAERVTVGVTALNLANRRFLLDNSATFGGTHYADPRQVYAQVRYRFHF
jgi:outer membrane receptor protein involved in Fe transport